MAGSHVVVVLVCAIEVVSLVCIFPFLNTPNCDITVTSPVVAAVVPTIPINAFPI